MRKYKVKVFFIFLKRSKGFIFLFKVIRQFAVYSVISNNVRLDAEILKNQNRWG